MEDVFYTNNGDYNVFQTNYPALFQITLFAIYTIEGTMWLIKM